MNSNYNNNNKHVIQSEIIHQCSSEILELLQLHNSVLFDANFYFEELAYFYNNHYCKDKYAPMYNYLILKKDFFILLFSSYFYSNLFSLN